MKRCPQCYEAYEDGARFCEADGRELLADPVIAPPVEPVTAPPAGTTRAVWWPAAALGILVGVVIGAGIFAAGSLMSASEANESRAGSQIAEPREAVPSHPVVASRSTPTPEAAESPSPEAEEQQAETQPSPATAAENKIASVQLNQGPISTGEKKTKSADSESGEQTVIEMNDGSTLDVDAAWEDDQGIWYRRGGLVSFVESSRVKAIAARRGTKVAENPHR